MSFPIPQNSGLTEHVRARFHQSGITDLAQLVHRRIGEVWSWCGLTGSAYAYKDWLSIGRAMGAARLSFSDSAPRDSFFSLSIQQYGKYFPEEIALFRFFNLLGPQAIELYDHVQLSDLEAVCVDPVCSSFSAELRSKVKTFLEAFWPEAPVLSEL
jgi:hypothetical protein